VLTKSNAFNRKENKNYDDNHTDKAPRRAMMGKARYRKNAVEFEIVASKANYCSLCKYHRVITREKVRGVVPWFSWCRLFERRKTKCLK
jgi:hypothetical protein